MQMPLLCVCLSLLPACRTSHSRSAECLLCDADAFALCLLVFASCLSDITLSALECSSSASVDPSNLLLLARSSSFFVSLLSAVDLLLACTVAVFSATDLSSETFPVIFSSAASANF